jgi:hypothetical protein
MAVPSAVPRLTGHTPRVPQPSAPQPSGWIRMCPTCREDYLVTSTGPLECGECRARAMVEQLATVRSVGRFCACVAAAELFALLVVGLWVVGHLGG